MTAADFFGASRVLIVAGKGGVGKTTVGATLGLAAARLGADVLLVELEGVSSLAAPFGHEPLGYETVTIDEPNGAGRLRARQITPDRALQEYLEGSGLSRISNRLARNGTVEVVATAAPGIRDLLALGKIRQLEQRPEADLIVVDAPAAGHAVTFLQAPSGLARSAATGPVRHQADLVLEMFADERRCQVVLVTMPEEAPVTEVIETAYSLEDRVGLKLGPVVVNACWTPIDGLAEAVASRTRLGVAPGPADEAAHYRLDRIAAQTMEIDRLSHELPLRQLRLPFVFSAALGRKELDQLADELVEQLDQAPT